MDADRFRLVEALFQEARRVPAGERDALLAGRCADDPALRAEVEDLLAEHDRADDALDGPALGEGFALDALVDTGADPVPADDDLDLPERIGPYRILARLGGGGMGVVFLASQDHPHRRVALKVLRSVVATPALRKRFEQEAELLGRLHHPGIAAIHDAGVTADGLPYIAMEHLEGLGLLEHCRAHDLSRRERVALMVRVCDAVEHAHRAGVVHRDLKPGNILVDATGDRAELPGGGVPKVVDFGVARARGDDLPSSLHTATGMLLGTVPYMSPEQAAGDPAAVDARSDVYALGVILFELLSGRLPHDVGQRLVHDAVRVIREEEPTSLATAAPECRGDLDTVVGKALEKDPARRYASAAELAADLRRHLDDEPVLAHPPSTFYQLRKFARRNRALVTLVGAVLVTLSAGLATTWSQWQRAEDALVELGVAHEAESLARQAAERRFDEVRSLARVFLFDLDPALRHVPGTLPARELLVDTGRDYLERLSAEAPADDVLLLREIAAAWSRLGDVQGADSQPNLGDHPGALESWTRALALLDVIAAEHGADGSLEHDRQLLCMRLGDAENALGRTELALEHVDRAIAICETAAERDPESVHWRESLDTARTRRATMLHALGRLDEALVALQASREAALDLLALRPGHWNARRDAAVAEFKLGNVLESRQDDAGALEHYERYLAEVEALLAEQPTHAVLLRDVLSGHGRLGRVQAELGNPGAAEEHRRAGLDLAERLVTADPEDATARFDYAAALISSGESALAAGRRDEAADAFTRAHEQTTALMERQPATPAFARRHGVALFKRGAFHGAVAADPALDAGTRSWHWREARRWFSESHALFVVMTADGRLSRHDAGVVDEIAAEIAACDEGLAALAGPP